MTFLGRWWAVALYECRLLWRSWAFRLSALAAVGILLLIQIIFTAPFSGAPFSFRSFSGALPLTAVRLLNLYLGLVTALLATEFVKRDRRLDSSEAVLANSFTNPGYVAGKMVGIGLALGGLAAASLAVVAVNHRFFTDAAFAWQPYVLLPLLGTLPTLVLTSGLACLLITLLRGQAVVLVLMLGVWAAAVFAGEGQFQLFDIFAFWIPMAWSDFVGFGNEEQLVRVRGSHLLAGLGCMAAAALLTPRLRQSLTANAAAAVVAAVCFGGAAWTGKSYLEDRLAARDSREHLVSLSRAASSEPAAAATACRIEVEHRGRELAAGAVIDLRNPHDEALDSLLFTLNPGFRVAAVAVDGAEASFRRDGHLLRVAPAAPLTPGDSARVRIEYRGAPDDGAAFLDVDRERFEERFGYWVITVAKSYGFVTPGFLHLTPESGWYPVTGLPPGAAFPAAGQRGYPRFRLSVQVPRGWTVFSQGEAQVDTTAAGLRCRFEGGSLPGISLTAGEYERRQVEVDGVAYSLAVRPGHAYFDAHLDSLGPALPGLVRELRAEYEAALGLEYPYPRLSLVEVPLQAWSYRRLWTLAQESVQPEIVYLPEMGTLCEAADFRRLKRRSRWSQERANQLESAVDLQSGYLRAFVEADLMGTRHLGWSPLGDSGLRGRYRLLPQFVSFATHLSSPRWPVLQAALESWFELSLSPGENDWSRRWSGLTAAERAGLTLQERSLRELLASPEEAGEQGLEEVAAIKARQLLLGFAATAGPDRFGREMTGFLERHRGRRTSEADLLEMLQGLGLDDPEARLEAWFGGTELPGYEIEEADTWLVRQGERTRTQVELTIRNPTAVDGAVEIGLRLRGADRDPWADRGAAPEHRRRVAVPAASSRRVGLVVDAPVAEMLVDTYVSRNLPARIEVPLPEPRLRRGAEPFDGERPEPPPADGPEGEYVVDNEDPGFEVLGVARPNWLRRQVADLFDLEVAAVPYVGFRFWSPPGSWEAATDPRFYGRFVLSGYYKKVGDGRSRVSWRTEIGEDGRYDLFFYLGDFEERRWRGRGGRGGNELSFLVHHEDGVESAGLDMATAEEGWNLLGTYPLAAGPAHVELTDRGPERTVVADAVKWTRRDPPRN